MAAALGVDFGACAVEVRFPVRFGFELVGEEAAAGTGGGGGMFEGEGAGAVDEVVRVDYGGGGDAVDGGAEVEEEGGFLGGLVGGHATGEGF